MKKTIRNLLFFLMISFLAGCQTEIDVTPPDYYNKLVVEGYIENGKNPVVSLHWSHAYFSDIDLTTMMQDMLITDAKVSITSDKGESASLTLAYCEDAPFYLAYTNPNVVGECNTTYTLTIELDNKIYTASTTILEPFDLDSIWFERIPELLGDSMANIRFALTDNPTQTNYYQFRVKIRCAAFQDRLWVNSMPAAFDDIILSGSSFEYEILRATPSIFTTSAMSPEVLAEYYRLTYKVGDTILVNYSQMDYDAYQFWVSANTDMTMGQNPFLTSSGSKSNISCSSGEEVLGVWCGYAGKTETMILNMP